MFRGLLVALVSIVALASLPSPGQAEGRSIVSGPYSLSVRTGVERNSGTIGVDGRADWLGPVLNIHAFGTYQFFDSDQGNVAVENQKYGAGMALSKTFSRQANLFAGTSWINEMGGNFSQLFAGAKYRIFDRAIVSGAYGWGLGHRKDVDAAFDAEAMSWYEVGLTVIPKSGLKLAGFYSMIAPNTIKNKELGGEISYPFRDDLVAGVKGSASEDFGDERLWKAYAFVTYSVGGQRKDPIEVALDKNDPARYPKVVRFAKAATAAACSATRSGALCDDCSDLFSIQVSVPASIGILFTNSGMDDTQLTLIGPDGTFQASQGTGPASPLSLSHAFTTGGTYSIQVDNFNIGGNYTLNVSVSGDTAACSTFGGVE